MTTNANSTFDLGLEKTGGRFIRFLASTNGWFAGGTEIPLDTFQASTTSVKTGWGAMAEGQAPDWHWDEVIGNAGPQPSPEHKRGFSVEMIIDGETFEWSSTGTGAIKGFGPLFSELRAGEANNPGKIALVKYVGSEAMKVGKGNTRKPNFKIVGWEKPTTPNEAAAKAFANAPALDDAEF